MSISKDRMKWQVNRIIVLYFCISLFPTRQICSQAYARFGAPVNLKHSKHNEATRKAMQEPKKKSSLSQWYSSICRHHIIVDTFLALSTCVVYYLNLLQWRLLWMLAVSELSKPWWSMFVTVVWDLVKAVYQCACWIFCPGAAVSSSGETIMPLFVMGTIMPGEKMALNIFEPRYRLMIRRVMEGSHRLGMAQPSRGGTVEPIAVECEIVECEPLPDGWA